MSEKDFGCKLKRIDIDDIHAKLNLACRYCEGRGVKQDYKKAFELAFKCAEQGLIAAMALLGDFYFYGWGVKKDKEKARYWFMEEDFCKSMLTENYEKIKLNQKGNGNMKYDVKTKCKNCGKIFTVREKFLFEIPDNATETKESWEELAFLRSVRGIEGFCPECRKYEIMIKHKRNWVEDFRNLEEEMQGFTKVGKIKDWEMWIEKLPKQKGIYAVTRESEDAPQFFEKGTGGFFKDRDPNVGIEELSKKWYYSSHKIMYIGRANYDNDNLQAQKTRATLQNRVKAYMRFGNNEKIGHWGGRYIWQLADSGELDVWYKVCDNPQTIESELIKKHKPFANLKKGDKD